METLARLFEYPGDDYPRVAAECAPGFALRIGGLSTEQLQELYIQTFDLNPDGCLDIGWHLFGEAYERGEFLVKVRSELRRYGIAESRELPDHLTHVLRLLARMGEEERRPFVEAFVIPALDKILASLDGKNNPFAILLRTIRTRLEPGPAAAGKPPLRAGGPLHSSGGHS